MEKDFKTGEKEDIDEFQYEDEKFFYIQMRTDLKLDAAVHINGVNYDEWCHPSFRKTALESRILIKSVRFH